MSDKPLLYDYAFSGNCYKVRLLLSQLGIEYETRAVDIIAGEARQPWFSSKNPLGQVPVLEWLCFEQSNVSIVIGRARFRRTFPEVIATRPDEFEAWHRQGNRALRVLEERLHDYVFVTDAGYTIADIALFAYVHCAEQGGFSLEPYAAIRSWIERIEEMPGYVAIDSAPAHVVPS